MDANRYATKKTIAQGMLDIALLTANASQLKYILQVGELHEFYTLMLILISISIIMQVGIFTFFMLLLIEKVFLRTFVFGETSWKRMDLHGRHEYFSYRIRFKSESGCYSEVPGYFLLHNITFDT